MLAAVPRRKTLLAAKALVVTGAGTVLGLAVAALVVVAGGGATAAILPAVLGTIAYIILSGLLGLGAGVLLRAVAPTVLTVVVGLFILPALGGGIRLGDTFLSDLLPGESGLALISGDPSAFGIALVWLLILGLAATIRFGSTDA